MKNLLKFLLSLVLAFILSLVIFSPRVARSLPVLLDEVGSPYHVAGPSMNPTLEDGQTVTVKMEFETLVRGDIVISVLPEAGYPFSANKDVQSIVKRIVGLPGETVDIGPDNTVYINGTVLAEPYLSEEARNATFVPGRETHFELGEAMYFVMGDNRTNSCDSRYFGPLKAGEITGLVDLDALDPDFVYLDIFIVLISTLILSSLTDKLVLLLFPDP